MHFDILCFLFHSYMDEVQRSLHVLFEGRKLLKVNGFLHSCACQSNHNALGQSRGPALRRGDTVVSTGGEDGMVGRRGVIETDLGDGAFLVKWSGASSSEARRVEARFLSRHSSQSHSVRMLNLYLLQVLSG